MLLLNQNQPSKMFGTHKIELVMGALALRSSELTASTQNIFLVEIIRYPKIIKIQPILYRFIHTKQKIKNFYSFYGVIKFGSVSYT